jgi:hypothetical protein
MSKVSALWQDQREAEAERLVAAGMHPETAWEAAFPDTPGGPDGGVSAATPGDSGITPKDASQ